MCNMVFPSLGRSRGLLACRLSAVTLHPKQLVLLGLYLCPHSSDFSDSPFSVINDPVADLSIFSAPLYEFSMEKERWSTAFHPSALRAACSLTNSLGWELWLNFFRQTLTEPSGGISNSSWESLSLKLCQSSSICEKIKGNIFHCGFLVAVFSSWKYHLDLCKAETHKPFLAGCPWMKQAWWGI